MIHSARDISPLSKHSNWALIHDAATMDTSYWSEGEDGVQIVYQDEAPSQASALQAGHLLSDRALSPGSLRNFAVRAGGWCCA